MTDYPLERGQGHMNRVLKFCPNYIFVIEVGHFKFRTLIDTHEC